MEDKVYGICSGSYDDWAVHGYFTTIDEADKYCAFKNKNCDYECDAYYVWEINKIDADVSNVEANHYHEVVFDFDKGMRREPGRYECYIGKDKPSKSTYYIFRDGSGWLSFQFNCKTRERAEKIAQDKYAQFLRYHSENNDYEKSAKLIGAKRIG